MSLNAISHKHEIYHALTQVLTNDRNIQGNRSNGVITDSKTRSWHERKKLSLTSAKILIVEDDEISQVALSWMLSSLGCNSIIAKSGRQAIEMYENDFDLIFLDIGLPDVTGVGVCMAIRSQEHLKHIPIIAITACEEMKDECLAVGVDEFVAKPLSLDKCEEILLRWLGGNN